MEKVTQGRKGLVTGVAFDFVTLFLAFPPIHLAFRQIGFGFLPPSEVFGGFLRQQDYVTGAPGQDENQYRKKPLHGFTPRTWALSSRSWARSSRFLRPVA